MLENVAVDSIEINEYLGAFIGSELIFECELILTYFVRISQEKGKWVTEVTFHDLKSSFVGDQIFNSDEEVYSCILILEEKGYLTIERKTGENDIIKVTEKFAELCEKYAQ